MTPGDQSVVIYNCFYKQLAFIWESKKKPIKSKNEGAANFSDLKKKN